MTDLEWLLASGLEVTLAPCGGPGRCCGVTGGRFSVHVLKRDAGPHELRGVDSHGHGAPAEALAFARDWCEQNGVAAR